jgi:GDP-L-fucose synthase
LNFGENMKLSDKIYVAGHRGMVGSAIVRSLKSKGFTNILTVTREEVDLLRQTEVETFFEKEKPDFVFLAAAKVGGILANDTYSAEFIYQNLMIEANIIHSAYKNNVKKLLFLGSSCIYPKFAPQPMKEEHLLTGILEPTNEAYAMAKISGIKMCQAYNKQYKTDFISAMPTNLYGINDNFDLKSSHVLPALIRKIHEAKINNAESVEIWGTGSPKREFLFVDDLADACVFLMEKYSGQEHVNVGVGEDISIKELAETIRQIVGFEGNFIFDTSKPDGTPRKLLDVSKLNNLGFSAKTSLEEGIKKTYQWFLENFE